MAKRKAYKTTTIARAKIAVSKFRAAKKKPSERLTVPRRSLRVSLDYHRPPTKRALNRMRPATGQRGKGPPDACKDHLQNLHREEEQPRYRAPDGKAIREFYPPADSRILQRKSGEIDRDRDCRRRGKRREQSGCRSSENERPEIRACYENAGRCHRYTPQTLLRPGSKSVVSPQDLLCYDASGIALAIPSSYRWARRPSPDQKG